MEDSGPSEGTEFLSSPSPINNKEKPIIIDAQVLILPFEKNINGAPKAININAYDDKLILKLKFNLNHKF